VIGGAGFVGTHLVTHLAERGWSVDVYTRHKQRHRGLAVLPMVRLVEGDIFDSSFLRIAFAHVDKVINLAGILNESKKGDFDRVHVDLPEKIMEAAVASGVSQVVHTSALNADAHGGASRYLCTKGLGEEKVHSFADRIKVATIKPSVIFGPGDSFFSRFARLLPWSPGILPLACPNARFAPVYVCDVVKAVVHILDNKTSNNQRYELCGPVDYELRDLVEFAARTIAVRRRIVGLGPALSRLSARLLQWFPGSPLTMDNVLTMQTDNLCASDGFQALGISPVSIESIVPSYLGLETKNRRYSAYRSVARHE